MKKPSLASALEPFDRPLARAAAGAAARPTHTPDGKAIAGKPPSRVNKKALIGYFAPAVSRQMKRMAADSDSSVQALLAEALNDLFRKHGKPAIA